MKHETVQIKLLFSGLALFTQKCLDLAKNLLMSHTESNLTGFKEQVFPQTHFKPRPKQPKATSYQSLPTFSNLKAAKHPLSSLSNPENLDCRVTSFIRMLWIWGTLNKTCFVNGSQNFTGAYQGFNRLVSGCHTGKTE